MVWEVLCKSMAVESHNMVSARSWSVVGPVSIFFAEEGYLSVPTKSRALFLQHICGYEVGGQRDLKQLPRGLVGGPVVKQAEMMSRIG